MSEPRISREDVEQVKKWAVAAASGNPVLIEEPAEKAALICCQLLAADDALKPFYDSGWIATLCAMESVPDTATVIISLKVETMGGATSEIKVGDFRKARAAMLPTSEVKDAN